MVAIGGGLVAGIAFSKLMCMLLYAMIGYHAEIVFYVSESGVVSTILLFAGIFMLTFIYNLFQIQLAKPVELLHGSSQGEREPKTKKLMAIVGIVTLAAGYYMAITVDNPVTAVLLFFVAVILVIIGTYFIFMAGSIAVLKFLRKRKVIIIKRTFAGSLWSYLPDETECSRTGKHLYFIHDGTGGNFFNGKYVCRTG